MPPLVKKLEPELVHDRRLIHQNDHITLWYYPKLKVVHHQMVHAPTSEEFRELLNKGAEILEQFAANKWLSDDRGNTLLRPHDEEWADSQWLPRVQRAGFKFWAIVLPAAAIGKLNMRRIANQHAQRGITSKIETTPEAALDWIIAQQ